MTIREAQVVTIQGSYAGHERVQLMLEAPETPSLSGATLRDTRFRGTVADLGSARIVSFETTLGNLRELKQFIEDAYEEALVAWESRWGEAEWVGQDIGRIE